jgi:hypothetical protein
MNAPRHANQEVFCNLSIKSRIAKRRLVVNMSWAVGLFSYKNKSYFKISLKSPISLPTAQIPLGLGLGNPITLKIYSQFLC